MCPAAVTLMRVTGTVAWLNFVSPLLFDVHGARLSRPPHMISVGPVRVPRRSRAFEVAVKTPSSSTGQVTTTLLLRRAALMQPEPPCEWPAVAKRPLESARAASSSLMQVDTSVPWPEFAVLAAVTSVPNEATRVRMPEYVAGEAPVPFAQPR